MPNSMTYPVIFGRKISFVYVSIVSQPTTRHVYVCRLRLLTSRGKVEANESRPDNKYQEEGREVGSNFVLVSRARRTIDN